VVQNKVLAFSGVTKDLNNGIVVKISAQQSAAGNSGMMWSWKSLDARSDSAHTKSAEDQLNSEENRKDEKCGIWPHDNQNSRDCRHHSIAEHANPSIVTTKTESRCNECAATDDCKSSTCVKARSDCRKSPLPPPRSPLSQISFAFIIDGEEAKVDSASLLPKSVQKAAPFVGCKNETRSAFDRKNTANQCVAENAERSLRDQNREE
jgi:hypothetical protein